MQLFVLSPSSTDSKMKTRSEQYDAMFREDLPPLGLNLHITFWTARPESDVHNGGKKHDFKQEGKGL